RHPCKQPSNLLGQTIHFKFRAPSLYIVSDGHLFAMATTDYYGQLQSRPRSLRSGPSRGSRSEGDGIIIKFEIGPARHSVSAPRAWGNTLQRSGILTKTVVSRPRSQLVARHNSISK